jgi:chromosome partitioning protein
LDAIDEAEENSQFIVVDLEGTASIAVANAVSRADLVIIPCQGSQDDADEAVKTMKLVKRQSRLIKRNIPVSILMTRTHAALMPRTLKHIVQQFSEANIDIFETTIIEREAFKAVRSFGGSIKDLNIKEVSGIDKAIDNTVSFTEEVLNKLKQAHAAADYKEVV